MIYRRPSYYDTFRCLGGSCPDTCCRDWSVVPDDDFLELAEQGYDVQQIASAMHSDVNLVALKADTLISQGYRLRPQEHRNDFLKYNR